VSHRVRMDVTAKIKYLSLPRNEPWMPANTVSLLTELHHLHMEDYE